MNIIANSCVGGYIYKNELKVPFQTPFIWSLVDFESMMNLYQFLGDINFNRIQILPDNYNNTQNTSFKLIIDNNVTVRYIHYKFSATDSTPRVDKIDVYYNRIWEYIYMKYMDRLHRMLDSPTKPLFIFANWFDVNDTALSYEQLVRLNNLKASNIICAVDSFYPKFPYIKQINRQHHNKIWNVGLAHNIYEQFIK